MVIDIDEVIDSKYRVVSYLGGGGMGSVLLVEDLDSGAQYALKYCHINDFDLKQRFAREVRLMKRISHRHVVEIIADNTDHAPPYFVMPVALNSLQSEIQTFLSDENAALDAFDQVCLGVQAIHNSNTIHRDIKPNSNRSPQSG